MATIKPIPEPPKKYQGVMTLGLNGTVSNPKGILTNVFRYLTKANPGQSNIYGSNVSTFKQLRTDYKNEPDVLADKTKEMLETVFNRYFPIVECETDAVMQDDGTYSIEITLAVTNSKGVSELLTHKTIEKLDF